MTVCAFFPAIVKIAEILTVDQSRTDDTTKHVLSFSMYINSFIRKILVCLKTITLSRKLQMWQNSIRVLPKCKVRTVIFTVPEKFLKITLEIALEPRECQFSTKWILLIWKGNQSYFGNEIILCEGLLGSA